MKAKDTLHKSESPILLIGKIPPPVGGVTIHVSRLKDNLSALNFTFDFCDLNSPLRHVFSVTRKYKVIHLHTSHPVLRFIYALYCKILNIQLIQTYHGNLGRFNFIYNLCDVLSVSLSAIPVLINQQSLEKAIKWNKKSILVSAFIQPIQNTPLKESLNTSLKIFKSKYHQVFSTTASCLAWDKNGNEIYGGSLLYEIFSQSPKAGLLFSDPTGDYKQYLEKKYKTLPDNIFFISEAHSFINVLQLSDCFIRATTTDGDSLSVKESICFHKPVIASDCVDRPKGCTLFKTLDRHDLESKIHGFQNLVISDTDHLDGFKDILNLYKKMTHSL